MASRPHPVAYMALRTGTPYRLPAAADGNDARPAVDHGTAPASWLIGDSSDRERMLDMDRRVQPIRQKSFVILALALLLCAPWLG